MTKIKLNTLYLLIVIPMYLTSMAYAEDIVNGDFELFGTGWTQFSSNGWDLIISKLELPSAIPWKGDYTAWLGGDINETSKLSQQFTILNNATHLRYYYWIDLDEGVGDCDHNKAYVRFGATELRTYSICQATITPEWQSDDIDIRAYRGQTINLVFEVATDAINNSSFFIDNVSIQSVDTKPPSPNPMTWLIEPKASSSTSITMTATTAVDSDNPPVYYFFEFVGSQTGGKGGTSSYYQDSPSYQDIDLEPNQIYGYRIRVVDASPSNPNFTEFSTAVARSTLANSPGVVPSSEVTYKSIKINWTSNGNPGWTEYYCENIDNGNNSGWIKNNNWVNTGLRSGQPYSFRVKARNGDEIETVWTDLGIQETFKVFVYLPLAIK